MNSGIITFTKETFKYIQFSIDNSSRKFIYFKNKQYIYSDNLKTYFKKKCVNIFFKGLHINFLLNNGEPFQGMEKVDDIQISTQSENVDRGLFCDDFISYLRTNTINKINKYVVNQIIPDTYNGCVLNYIITSLNIKEIKPITEFYSDIYNILSNYMKLKSLIGKDVTSIQLRVIKKLSEKIDFVDFCNDPFYILDETMNKYFDTLCKFAKILNLEKSKVVCGTINHCLYNFIINGHMCGPTENIKKIAFTNLCKYYSDHNEDIPTIEDIRLYMNERQFAIFGNGSNEMILIKKVFNIVNFVSKTVQGYIEEYYNTEEDLNIIDISQYIFDYEALNNIKFSGNQYKAIKLPFMSKGGICMLTGLPGSGKTSCVHCIKYVAEKLKKKFILAAPTGKSANKMDKNAYTIHRLLESVITRNGKLIFNKNDRNKLDMDLLILDESSMIDIDLFYNMMKASPKDAMIVLIGDTNQLPCIRYGELLKSLIQTDLVAHVHLSKIYRQGSKSDIPILSKMIVEKENILKFLGNSENIRYLNKFPNSKVLNKFILQQYVKNRNLQILIPMNVGLSGTKAINKLIHEYLYPNKPLFEIGEKIICTSNSYHREDGCTINLEKSMLNGEIGYFDGFCENDNQYKVLKVDKTEVIVDKECVDYGYAITIHKSQGSEYDDVLLYIPKCDNDAFSILNNELLYTAITRTKKYLTIISDDDTINFCLNNSAQNRYDILRDLILNDMEICYE